MAAGDALEDAGSTVSNFFKSLGGGATGSPGDYDPNDPRWRDLGTDKETGQFRQTEADAARRLEEKTGLRLERYDPNTHPISKYGDWIAKQGDSYVSFDAVGPLPNPQYFNMSSFVNQIDVHLLKQGVDYVVVDVTGLEASQIAGVQNHLGRMTVEQLTRIVLLVP